jgi:hypothetical protein
MKHLATTAIVLATLFCESIWADEVLAPLEWQATVVTQGGRVYRGWLDGYRSQRVRLRVPADEGEAIYQFSVDAIRSLIFPRTQKADEALAALEMDPDADVLGVLEETWSERIAYMPALDRPNRAPLLAYAEALLKDGHPLEAVARGRRLKGIALDTDERERMDTVVIVGHEQAGLLEEASILAEVWCQGHEASGSSVLGWVILARQALRQEAWDEAIWLALHPIAFGHDATVSDLDMCYGAAIAANLNLENAEQAVVLFNEMQERGIQWPDEEPLLERASAILAQAMVDETQSIDRRLADEISAPPVPDPKLSLESVRRLLAKPRS